MGCDAASVIVLHDLLHGFPGDIHAQEQDKAKGKYEVQDHRNGIACLTESKHQHKRDHSEDHGFK